MSGAASSSSNQSQVPGNPSGTDSKSGQILVKGTFELAGKQKYSVTLDASDKILTSSMESISTEEIQKFVGTIESVQGTEILSLLSSLFDFMGFDPIQIIKKLLAINKFYQGKKGMEDESLDTLKQDIMMMVAANIIMGNLQVKTVGRRSAQGRAALEYLVSKYNMKMGSTGAGLPSDTLTFPRVANSFPVLACRSAMVFPSKNLPKSPFLAKSIPKFMRVTSFAAFCSEEMEESTRMFLLRCVCAFSCDHMVTVHAGEMRKSKRKLSKDEAPFLPEDAWSAQWDYIFVSSTSPVPSLEMKRAMMTEFKVESYYDQLRPIADKIEDLIQDKTPIPTKEQFQKSIRDFISDTRQGQITGP